MHIFIDKINKICVNTYVKSFTVTYIVIIDCGASSNHTYGNIQYIWDFNNGKNITTSLSTVITTYQFTGVYNFSLLASNNVSRKKYAGQIYIDTGRYVVNNSNAFDISLVLLSIKYFLIILEPDTTNVQIFITGPRFTLVNVTVLFSISPKIPVTDYLHLQLALYCLYYFINRNQYHIRTYYKNKETSQEYKHWHGIFTSLSLLLAQ